MHDLPEPEPVAETPEPPQAVQAPEPVEPAAAADGPLPLAPADAAPADIAPADPTPADTAPADTAPADTAPADTVAVVPEAAAPEAAAAPTTPDLSPAACAARLAELFPALFSGPPKPIKLRIQADIQARAPGVFTKRSLSLFLHRHTTSTAYLKSMVNMPQRFDLDGAPAGELAPEHLEAAKVEVERRRAIVKERIKTQRDAQRQAETQALQARREAEHAAFKAQRKEQQKAEREAAKARKAAEETWRQEQQARWGDDQARRDRANLLRSFEASTLTKANFCVLKRIAEAELDAQLKLARDERAAWQQQAPAPMQPRQAPSRPR